jgi:UPF0755 protein
MTKKNTKDRDPLFGACLLPAIALTLLGIVVILGLVANVPAQAVKRFGPAAERLDSLTRFVLSAQLLLQGEALTRPANPNGAAAAFTVQTGETVPSVANRLYQAGLISNPGAFRIYLQYRGLDVTLQAGDYTLSSAMTALEISQALQDPTPATAGFHILAGWRLEEVALALAHSGLAVTPEDFWEAAQAHPAGYSFSDQLPAGATLEGLLFPGVYDLPRTITAPQLLAALLGQFEASVGQDLRQGFTDQGLSLYEAVIVASIVEREAIQDEEMPQIASVYLNRLAIGMKLDADPTIQYALGYNTAQSTWWTNPLSLTDLQVVSAYNTYLAPGLPPGPICNPSLTALRAVAFPAQTPYYYFRAACDGSGRHNFAETFDDHLANGCP